ncbi:hypothetical protein RchiOBHm_Chr5g0076221 [Rosa chinensis]|uniref:Uncharacterized protein n=1 Tax=Rosa chinensis TaxID=74649 RepID=A0A2P6QLN4_ROSCH|nr:hypothetical protein RchiOBHm_Chr5g0076221 [Rosa chinensis]
MRVQQNSLQTTNLSVKIVQSRTFWGLSSIPRSSSEGQFRIGYGTFCNSILPRLRFGVELLPRCYTSMPATVVGRRLSIKVQLLAFRSTSSQLNLVGEATSG